MTAVVVGGGVIGLGVALELREAGEEVTLVERDALGAESSGAAAGILGAQAESPGEGPLLDLCLQSRALYPAYVEKLEALSGVPLDHRRHGVLKVALGEKGLRSLERTAHAQRGRGLRAELLSGADARRLEPLLNDGVAGALWLPDDSSLDNRQLVRALELACRRAGVTFRTGHVRSLWRRGDMCVGVDVDGEPLGAERVLVAAGAFTCRIGALPLAADAVQAARGQMVALRARKRSLGGPVLFGEQGYLVPRSDGRVLAGSTVELGQVEKRVTARGVQTLLERACALCPPLQDAAVEELWSGLRPVTPDHLPILGPGPLGGLFLATGHFRNGILLTPVTARLLAQCMLGKAADVSLGPFRYDRPALSAPSSATHPL